jgi:integrase/recombinase XerD
VNDHISALLAYLEKERGLSTSTIAAYRNDLLSFAEFLDSEAERDHTSRAAVATISREQIRDYLQHLRNRGYSPASLARKIAALRSFFRYLCATGAVVGDPTVSVGLPDAPTSLQRTVRDSDVHALFLYCDGRQTHEGMRDHALLSVLRATGMRVGELVNVDVSDVDLASARVRVVGRANRERMLPLDEESRSSLERYLQHARPVLTRHSNKERALMVNQRGQRLTRTGFWLIMRHLVRDAGVAATLTPNTLRHRFASRQIGRGLGLEELRRLLGHASITTTLLYTRMVPPQPINITARRGA